jgi:hypothetical protein
MKVTRIFDLLETARKVRKSNGNTIPCFVGESGIGKTEMVYQYAREKDLEVRTLIISQLDSTDFAGIIYKKEGDDHKMRMSYALPEFWPTKGEGILFLDEVNRGREELQAPLLQLLHERRLHDYKLPNGWIIATAINPDNEDYGVNSMNRAMTSRLSEYEVFFDKKDFIKYAEQANFDTQVLEFVKSSMWQYHKSDQISKDANAKYICPRTWKILSDIKKADKDKFKDDPLYHREIVCSNLGGNIGESFHKFCYDESPILARDLIKDKEASLNKLKAQSSKKNYKGASISITVDSIAENFSLDPDAKNNIDLDTLADVLRIINADQSALLIEKCGMSKGCDIPAEEFIDRLIQEYPDVKQKIVEGLAHTNKN